MSGVIRKFLKVTFKVLEYNLSDMERDESTTYLHPKTTYYKYIIKEDAPTEATFEDWIDYNYNELTWYVTVQLTYDQDTGEMSADKRYSTEGWCASDDEWAEASEEITVEFINVDAETEGFLLTPASS